MNKGGGGVGVCLLGFFVFFVFFIYFVFFIFLWRRVFVYGVWLCVCFVLICENIRPFFAKRLSSKKMASRLATFDR